MSQAKKADHPKSEPKKRSLLTNKLHLEGALHLDGLIFDGEIANQSVEEDVPDGTEGAWSSGTGVG